MTSPRHPRRAIRALGAAGCMTVALGLLLAGPAQAAVSPAPGWQIESVAQPTNFAPGDATGDDTYVVTVTNDGSLETNSSDPTIITDTLPAGLTAKEVEFFAPSTSEETPNPTNLGSYLCTTTPLSCEYPGVLGLPLGPGFSHLQPGQKLKMVIHVEVGSTEGPLTNGVEVSGGGAPSVSTSAPNAISSHPAPFGLQQTTRLTALDGSSYTQAGGHPYEMTTTINFNTELTPQGKYVPSEEAKNIISTFPTGLIGNPQAVPLCSNSDFALNQCPVDSQVGTISFESATGPVNGIAGLYNLAPATGYAAEFGYHPPDTGIGAVLTSSVRTGSDYAQRTLSANDPTYATLYTSVTLWGVPAAPIHDPQRGCESSNQLGCPSGSGVVSGAKEESFLSLPSSCSSGPLTSTVTADGWNFKADQASSVQLPAVDGCNQVSFEPKVEARPTTNLADSPSGLTFDLHVPQSQAAEGTATANLKDAVLTFPPGITVNPAAAAGLGACTESEFDLHGEGPAQCPDASKLGTVELDTPLLDHPLPGAVYLAKPDENPFASLLGIYVSVDDPVSGVVVKLAGKIAPDPVSGRLTVSFEENPQQPFEDLRLNFFGGAQGALRTPATCGGYETTSQLTPWSAPESGPPATLTDSFSISAGPSGGACAHSRSEEENRPSFLAGTETPQGGTYSSLSLRLVREDGSQELQSVETTLPRGLLGRLAGVPYCSDAQIAAAGQRSGAAEQASPSCPLASQIGTVEIGAGAGPDPYYVQGQVYLAGPYKSAPLSLAIVTPALAGPFDLGTVVVRVALYVDPATTQIRAVSDPIPAILQGIPLDLRSITLKANRPKFTLNPTSCGEMFFTGSEISVLSQVAPLSQRFQVANCAGLPFAPKLALRFSGSVKRRAHPALRATLTAKPGSANIATTSVALPHSLLLDNAHIKSPCTKPAFAAHNCPPGSVLGYAKAESPLLERPLQGPVYLASGYGHELPDLVAELNGQIDVILDGRIDTDGQGGLRTTFEALPDAPISKFTLSLKGGKVGLLQNSENLCKTPRKAIVKMLGQNGKVSDTRPLIATSCKKQHGGVKHHKKARG